jgi:hypothetical protein
MCKPQCGPMPILPLPGASTHISLVQADNNDSDSYHLMKCHCMPDTLLQCPLHALCELFLTIAL